MKSALWFIRTSLFIGFGVYSSLIVAEGSLPYKKKNARANDEVSSHVSKQVSHKRYKPFENLPVSSAERRLPQRWVNLESPAVKELERLGVRVFQDYLINVDGVRFDRVVWRSELHKQLSRDLEDPVKADKIESEFYSQIYPELLKQSNEDALSLFEEWLLSHAIFLGSSIHRAMDLYSAHHISTVLDLDSDLLDSFFESLKEEWERVDWPEDPYESESRRVMFLTTSGGGGHYTVSSAMSKELKKDDSYHVESLDYAALQFRCDPMWLATKVYTADKIYSEIFQQQDDVQKANLYWDIYGVLDEYVPSACNRALKEEVKAEQPHILISTMPHWTLHTDVAYSLDIPLRYTATDYQIASGIFKSIYSSLQNVLEGAKRFVEFWLPTNDVEMFTDLAHQDVYSDDAHSFRDVVRKAVYGGGNHFEIHSHPKNPFYVLGYPVRHSFVPKKLSEKEILNLREEMNVPKESRVLILSMGRQGVGVLSEIVDRIRREAESLEENLHVVVICGKNIKIADDIKKILAEQGDHKRVSFDIQGYLTEQSMAKFFSIAEGMISKPGGATTAEASAMNLPLLICHSHAWEEANRAYLERKGLSFHFDLMRALVPQVNVFLGRNMKKNAKVEVVPWATRLKDALEEFFTDVPFLKI
ncbi:MAG: hypothetical protein AB8C84_07605 [Oligoflexales bacterium]